MKKKGVSLFFLITIIVFVTLFTKKVSACDARDYCAPLSEETKLFLVYYQHITSHKWYVDRKKVSRDINLSMNIFMLRPVYHIKIGPFLCNYQVVIPFGEAQLDGKDVGGDFSNFGLGDPIIASTIWLINKPESRNWVAFATYFQLPLGDYDQNKPVNLGNNRVMFKEELFFLKGIAPKTLFEIGGSVELYTENHDFGPGKVTLEQDNKYIVETKLSYDLFSGAYIAGEYFYTNGSETTIDHFAMHDEISTHAGRCTLGFMLNPHYQILLQYAQDLDVKNGPKTNTFSTRFLLLF